MKSAVQFSLLFLTIIACKSVDKSTVLDSSSSASLDAIPCVQPAKMFCPKGLIDACNAPGTMKAMIHTCIEPPPDLSKIFVGIGPEGRTKRFGNIVTVYVAKDDPQPKCGRYCKTFRIIYDGLDPYHGNTEVSSTISHVAVDTTQACGPLQGSVSDRIKMQALALDAASPLEATISIEINPAICKRDSLQLVFFGRRCEQDSRFCQQMVIKETFALSLKKIAQLSPISPEKRPNTFTVSKDKPTFGVADLICQSRPSTDSQEPEISSLEIYLNQDQNKQARILMFPLRREIFTKIDLDKGLIEASWDYLGHQERLGLSLQKDDRWSGNPKASKSKEGVFLVGNTSYIVDCHLNALRAQQCQDSRMLCKQACEGKNEDCFGPCLTGKAPFLCSGL